MAWQVSKRVWDILKGNPKMIGDDEKNPNYIDSGERLLLLALADKADENGICWPKYDTSYQTLGDLIGVNRRSAMRLADNLAQVGRIWKSETAGRGHSNIFIVTIGLSKDEIKERLAIKGVADDTIYNEVKVSPEAPINEPEKEMVLPVTQNGVVDNTIKGLNGVTGNTQSFLKNPSLPINLKEGESHKDRAEVHALDPQAVPPPLSEEFLTDFIKALAEVCRWNLRTITSKRQEMLKETAEKLGKEGISPPGVRAFGKWWYEGDWRGKKNNEAPTPSQILDEWGKFENKDGVKNGSRATKQSQPGIIAAAQRAAGDGGERTDPPGSGDDTLSPGHRAGILARH